MKRFPIDVHPAIFPMPVMLVGALVDEKPNYMTAAWVTPVNVKPVMIAVAMGNTHHTTKGIIKEGVFGISIPSCDQVRAVDYAGMVSGKEKDKSGLFHSYYGKLERAPMAEECPVGLECRLVQAVPMVVDTLFIAELTGIYTSEEYLTNDILDMDKIRPFAFTMPDKGYWTLGDRIGDAWDIGKGYPDAAGQGGL